MPNDLKRKIAFISSSLPRKCGIATFTSDLIENITKAAEGQFKPLVVAMRDDDNLRYENPVKFEIRQNVKNDYISAANYINFSHVDLVSVQHEFGLFGGNAGSYLTLLLDRLNAPIVTTLHTVLNNPNPNYFRSLQDICNASCKVITMNERGVDMLKDIYGVVEEKISLIPHGIPDLSFVDNNYYKHKFGMEGRRTILTFGLLSKNKGIEVMLKAMPEIVKTDPTVLYVILGMTHPSVIKHDGESYRFSLQQMVKELRLQKHVIFHNRFVSDDELQNFLCAADLYVTPYLSEEQLTSGTLSFAVGTGKAVVSTPYWAAKELLSNGQGMLVPFGDSDALAQTICKIINDDQLFYSMRRKAYDYGRSRTWPKIGQEYWKLFSDPSITTSSQEQTSAIKSTINIEVPEPSLVHIKRLTDDTGIYQHAKFTIPDRLHGYCTDDNARAVIAMTKFYEQYPNQDALKLFDTYLSFMLHAQTSDGSVRNFLNFDRSWMKKEPSHDALGRVLWAMGVVLASPPLPVYLPIIKNCFDRSIVHIEKLHPRGMAYSIIGMCNYLKQFPGASDIKRYLTLAADSIVEHYDNNAKPGWLWFSDHLTYDNAILPCALFIAGSILGEKYLKVAQTTCDFLLEHTFKDDHFSFVGCYGWFPCGQTKADFDQQPIEAASTIMMLKAAYEVTGDINYLATLRKAFDWFLGENDLRVPVYNFRTKGCHDSLTRNGVNHNQGAESILSFLMSLLDVVENCAVAEKSVQVKKPQQIADSSSDSQLRQMSADKIPEKVK